MLPRPPVPVFFFISDLVRLPLLCFTDTEKKRVFVLVMKHFSAVLLVFFIEQRLIRVQTETGERGKKYNNIFAAKNEVSLNRSCSLQYNPCMKDNTARQRPVCSGSIGSNSKTRTPFLFALGGILALTQQPPGNMQSQAAIILLYVKQNKRPTGPKLS